MADENREILIDIELDNKDFDKEIASVNKELKDNRKNIKELSKDYENNGEEIAKLERKNKDLSASKRDLIKQSNTESNSLNALRLRLANLTKERNNLDLSLEGNAERFAELQNEIKGTSDEIKGFEQAGGDFRRNVGNYKESVSEAIGETQVFGTSVGDLGKVFTSATGLIGATVAVLGGLFKAYTSSARGAEDLQRATDKLNEVYNTFSQTLADTFGGDGEGGLLERALDSLLTRVTSVETKVRAELAATAATRIRDLQVEKVQQDVAAKEQLQRAEQLRQIRDDDTRSIQERIDANEELFGILETRNKEVVKLENDRLENLKVLSKLDEGNRDILIEIANTKLAIADIDEETEGFRSEALINRNSLQQEALDKLEAEKKAKLDAADPIGEAAETVESKDAEIETEKTDLIQTELNKRVRANIIASREIVKDQEKKTKEEIKLFEARKKAAIAAQAALTNSIVNLLGKETAAGKAFALSQIVSDSARGVSGAIAAGAGIPFPANLAAIATGVSSVLSGIVSAKSLLSGSGGGGGGGGFSLPSFAGSPGASQSVQQNPTIIQPSLLSQFSQPVQNQAALENAASVAQPAPVVSVVDIVKGLNDRSVKVADSSL